MILHKLSVVVHKMFVLFASLASPLLKDPQT